MAFQVFLAIHIPAGLIRVILGIVATLSKKQPGRHPRFGTIYYCAFAVVFFTATGIAVERWSQDYHLFLIGAVAFGSASAGYTARRIRWRWWLPYHIPGMGLSYVALLTAIYVDNGPNLPIWQLLPHLTYWLLPSAIGVPLILHAMVRPQRNGKVKKVVPQRAFGSLFAQVASEGAPEEILFTAQ